MAGSCLQGQPSPVLRAYADGEAVPAEEPRGADPGLLRHRPRGRREDPAIFLGGAQDAVADPALRTVSREVRGGRIVRAGNAGRLAPWHLLFQRLRPSGAEPMGREYLVSARGCAGPPLPDQPGAGERGAAPFMRFGGNTAFEGWALRGNAWLRHGGVRGPLPAVRNAQ